MRRLIVAPACVVLAGVLTALVLSAATSSAATATIRPPPTGQDQWFWDIGGNTLPPTTGAYPAAGSANIWDTDDYGDANSVGSNNEPDGPSSVVTALHASGKYSICYIEAGAQQPEPDSSDFAAADYTNGSAKTTQMQGYSSEYWFDLRGFAGFQYGDSNSVLTGAAGNIAAGLANRIEGCAAEGQDALEPDDLDGYTNKSASGAAGGGWGLTQADSAGFEAWLATTAHADGLAIFQKNDPANSGVDEPNFDGMIIEECNYYQDPCTGSGGDATAYLNAGKPVLNAEYTEDGETTSKFCSADIAAGITGALFNVDLDGKTYEPCAPVGSTDGGGTSTTSTTPTTSTTTTTTTSTSSTTPTTTTTTSTTTTAPPPPPPPPPPATPVNSKRPVISGTVRQGQQLKTTTGTWTGASRYTYAWQRCEQTCSTIKNATQQTYNLGASDVGHQLKAIVTAHNTAGTATAASAPTVTVTVAKRSRGGGSARR